MINEILIIFDQLRIKITKLSKIVEAHESALKKECSSEGTFNPDFFDKQELYTF